MSYMAEKPYLACQRAGARFIWRETLSVSLKSLNKDYSSWRKLKLIKNSPRALPLFEKEEILDWGDEPQAQICWYRTCASNLTLILGLHVCHMKCCLKKVGSVSSQSGLQCPLHSILKTLGGGRYLISYSTVSNAFILTVPNPTLLTRNA